MPQALQQHPKTRRPAIVTQSKMWFTYSATFSTLRPGTTQTQTITIQNDADFEVVKQVSNAYVDTTGAAGTQVYSDLFMGIHYPGLVVILTENDTQSQLMDVATPVCSIFGTAQQPFVLPNTYVLNANATMSIQLSNLYTGETVSSITLSFIGRKLYRGVA